MLETSQAQSVIFTMQSSSAGHQRLVSSTLSSTSSYRRDAFDGQIIQTQPGPAHLLHTERPELHGQGPKPGLTASPLQLGRHS